MTRLRHFRVIPPAFLFALALAAPGPAWPQAAHGQEKDQAAKSSPSKRKVFRTKGREPATGTDPNVKSQSYTSTLESAVKLAPNKTRVKAGSTAPGVCAIHVDNWTSAVVHIFLSGDYEGSVGPGATMDIPASNGNSIFYGRIDLDQNSWIALGPEPFNCDGNFSFTITP
jgi:hypothetical protein